MDPALRRVRELRSDPWLGIACLLAAAALVISAAYGNGFAQTSTEPKPRKLASDVEAWQHYEKSFESRWRHLLQHPERADKSKWTVLESDLRTSAKKHNEHLEEEASKPMTGTTSVVNATFTVPCLSQYDKPGNRCFIFPERNGHCRYICVSGFK